MGLGLWADFKFPPINLWVLPPWQPRTEHDNFMITLYTEHRDLTLMIEGWPEETAEIVAQKRWEEETAAEWYPAQPY